MKFTTLGSSSSGNSYYFQTNSGQILVLECGVNISALKKSIGHDMTKVLGALVSHSHGDHSARIPQFLKAGIDVYIEEGNKPLIDLHNSHRVVTYREKKPFRIGEFEVIGFPLVHDVHINGFLIRHPEMGTTCFITDTAYCEYTFPNLTNVILEANYSKEIMMQRWVYGELNGMVRDRVYQSHMSFENAMGFLKANDLSKVNQIVLIHLSSGNADPEKFKTETEKLTMIPTEVASPGKVVELNLEPF